jgi:hypothetical protein
MLHSQSEPDRSVEGDRRRLGCPQSNLLSYGVGLVLINSVLIGLPMFMLSFLEIPVGVAV